MTSSDVVCRIGFALIVIHSAQSASATSSMNGNTTKPWEYAEVTTNLSMTGDLTIYWNDDEGSRKESIYMDSEKMCENNEEWCGGSCSVNEELICKGIISCANIDLCDIDCPNYRRCPETSECVLVTESCIIDKEEIYILGKDTKQNATWYPFPEWQTCTSRRSVCNGLCLVRRDYICDGKILCPNLNPCDVKCEHFYRCRDSNECVSRSTICNGNTCDGCMEDHGWKNGVGFKCLRDQVECILPQQLLHDDIPDCDGGIDLCFGAITALNAASRDGLQPQSNLFHDKCFQCLNDIMLIPTSRVCDGIIDCSDLSDECLCVGGKRPDICNQVILHGSKVSIEEETPAKETTLYGSWEVSGWNIILTKESATNETLCAPGSIKCETGTCIPRSAVCDGELDCDNDESFEICRGTIGCQYASKKGEVCRCKNERLCKSHCGIACDGIPDCPVPEFSAYEIIPEVAEDECAATCPESSNYECLSDRSFEPGLRIMACPPSGEDYRLIIDDQICDGIQDCPFGEDETDCSDRFECETVDRLYVSIAKDQICDGVIDCTNGTDESIERCQEERFFCKASGGWKVNIGKYLLCDFVINCDDESDEKNCNDSRFYCEHGEPLFVTARQKFDGRGDCSDWSDECPMLNQTGAIDAFSSRYELIGNPVLRVLVWIMGLLSICGNAFVLFTIVKRMREKGKLPAIILTNRILLLNLATSDFLMGVYLISLGIAGATMSGHYCVQSLQWRTSSTCKTLGVLSVLSSETSVITIVMLTSCRLYAILNPFKTSTRPRKSVVALIVISSWAISLTLALVPLAPQLSGTFVSHCEYKDSPYFQNIETSLDEARQVFQWLLTYDLKHDVLVPDGLLVEKYDWFKLEEEAKKLFLHKHLRIERVFSYYSTHGACIPKFFITISNRAWGFSFFITLLNFFSFVFVASSYAAIYFQSKKQANIRSSSRTSGKDRNEAMQRKILRLIITDFCCWMPISVMAFLNLGGVDISDTAYAITAIVLLPINSALNPVLYSNLPDLILEEIKSLKRLFSKNTVKSVMTDNRNHEAAAV